MAGAGGEMRLPVYPLGTIQMWTFKRDVILDLELLIGVIWASDAGTE